MPSLQAFSQEYIDGVEVTTHLSGAVTRYDEKYLQELKAQVETRALEIAAYITNLGDRISNAQASKKD